MTDFDTLRRAVSPSTGDPTLAGAGYGENYHVEAGEWTRLGSTDYELLLNIGWRPVRWVVARVDGGHVHVGVDCMGGLQMVVVVAPAEVKSRPALLANSFQHLGGDVTIDARLRYNPAVTA